jgi:tetratricopeptide (TPR) repeat protein
MNDSGQVIYSRQFVLEGAGAGEIVTITYASASADIFNSTELADAIQPPAKATASPQKEAYSYYQRGLRRGQQRDYGGAIRDFDKAVELAPELAEVYVSRGKARGGLVKGPGDLAEVLKDYDKAIELRPDYAEAYYNRGVARQASGNFAGAIADYGKVIELNPDYAPAYEHRGKLKKSKGDLNGAQEDFDKAAQAPIKK